MKKKLLKNYFGHEAFRDGQEKIIDEILSGRDVLAIMPTGAGKSVCYQLPALMLDGITVVISPLISLMKDQVNSLIQSGISCAYINSSLNPSQLGIVMERARNNQYKIIYIAPERLMTPSFISFAENAKISMISVDEAHCVSQWGQDFRPSYVSIREFAASLPFRPIISAFTATATDAVKKDIVKMLALNNPYTVTTGFDRKNLYFSVCEPDNKLLKTRQLVEQSKNSSGIIYCSTRKNTEAVYDYLNSVGIPCLKYHAGLSDDERRRNQEDFICDRVKVMAATNAFGMGIDKSNVSFVIHYNMPKDIESYYQEAGRAGRDGSEALCTLLFSRQDIRTNRFLIDKTAEDSQLDPTLAEALRQRDYMRLNEMVKYCTTTDCLRHFILSYFGEKSNDYCGKCSSCENGCVTEDVTIASQKILSCIFRLKQRNLKFGETMVTDILCGSKNKKLLDMSLDSLSTYAIITDVKREKIRQIIQGLCGRGYIRKDEHDALVLTASAKEVLIDGKNVTMSFKKQSETKPKVIKKASGRYEENEELFELLKQLRLSIAQKARVPAYIIFPDSSLHDMCRKLPKTLDEFSDVSGVGQNKLQRYGKDFVRVINDFAAKTDKNPEHSNTNSPEQLSSKRIIKPLTLEQLSQKKADELGSNAQDEREKILNFLSKQGFVALDNSNLTVTALGGTNGIHLSTTFSDDELVTEIVLKKNVQLLIEKQLYGP